MNQIAKINEIVKQYDSNAKVVGEGPLMKDLVEISDHDFNSVNTVSIGIIFVIMMFVLKSISLPVLLVIAIEFAIFINMGIPYYTNTTIPFIASIVIGTIQLGATIDYAILITTKYIQNRKDGKDKKQAVSEALGTSINSIIVSGLCFFGATFGVGAYSKIEMIGSLCTLMSRGAIISVIVVITVLPAFLMIFDKLVCKTTIGMREVKN
jgi:predicted RND superfamily exporter protein